MRRPTRAFPVIVAGRGCAGPRPRPSASATRATSCWTPTQCWRRRRSITPRACSRCRRWSRERAPQLRMKGGRMRPEFATREFWETRRVFLRKAALLTLTAAAAWTTWDHFCWLGYDPQQISCTGYRLFVVVRHQVPTRAGQYVAFVTDDRFAPMFRVGERFGKLIVCTFPCHVEEGVDHLTVNGHVRDSINPA